VPLYGSLTIIFVRVAVSTEISDAITFPSKTKLPFSTFNLDIILDLAIRRGLPFASPIYKSPFKKSKPNSLYIKVLLLGAPFPPLI
jgi:hypothetical protein